jgi:hypothetical protein
MRIITADGIAIDFVPEEWAGAPVAAPVDNRVAGHGPCHSSDSLGSPAAASRTAR